MVFEPSPQGAEAEVGHGVIVTASLASLTTARGFGSICSRAERRSHPLEIQPIVIGTAGHIDHGKSTLVRALTGIEPDRFKEEQ